MDRKMIISTKWNSKNAVKNNSFYLSDVVYAANELLKNDPYIVYSEIGILGAQIPVSFYTINNANNVLQYQVNSKYYSITITPGNYNWYSLQSELNDLFSLKETYIRSSLNQVTGSLTFTLFDISNFTFLSSSTCSGVLGFQSTLTSTNSNLTMTFPMNSIGVTKIKAVSKLVTNNFDRSQSNVINAIPASVTSGGLIAKDNQSQYKNLLRRATCSAA